MCRTTTYKKNTEKNAYIFHLNSDGVLGLTPNSVAAGRCTMNPANTLNFDKK